MIYTIKKGDTLTDISLQFLGNPARYVEIYELNRGNLRSGNPDLIYPGEQIIIPIDNNTENSIKKPDIAKENELVLEINGQQFTGWEDVQVDRSIETCADMFAVSSVFEPGKLPKINPTGLNKCRVSIGDELIITGRIDIVSCDIASDGVSLQLAGRSLAGQLVDVSVMPPYEFSGQTLTQIAKKVCRPYGIPVKFEASDGGKIEKAVAEHGQTVYDFLNKLANQKGLLITSSPNGGLLFTRLNKNGVPVGQIEEGKGKFESASAEYNMQERFSNIIVDGQPRTSDTEYESGATAEPKQGKAIDNEIKKSGVNRTLIIEAPETPESNDLNTVAKWEVSKRIATSQSLSVQLENWKKPDSEEVWKENDTVLVKIPSCLILDPVKYIVSEVSFNRSADGTSCELSLILPDAYNV